MLIDVFFGSDIREMKEPIDLIVIHVVLWM